MGAQSPNSAERRRSRVSVCMAIVISQLVIAMLIRQSTIIEAK